MMSIKGIKLYKAPQLKNHFGPRNSKNVRKREHPVNYQLIFEIVNDDGAQMYSYFIAL